jgi:photosystem II stability/assembly factor-like uncharacterized protein
MISDNASAQWFQAGNLSNLGQAPLISVVDSNVVWTASGETGPVVRRTVNGGASWTSVSVNGLPYGLSGIAGKDSLNAFVCDYGGDPNEGGNAKLYRTTNAGVNWSVIDSTGGTNGFFNGIVFSKSDPQTGIAFSDPPLGTGTPYFILKTTNGGNSWFRQNPAGVPDTWGIYYNIFVIDNLFYGFNYFNFSNSSLSSYLTSDGGVNWVAGNENYEYEYGSDIVFCDNKNTGILLSAALLPNIQRTVNTGLNWSPVNTNSGISGFIAASWVSGSNTVFICAENNTSGNAILRSDNGGLDWTAQNTSGILELVEIDYARYNDKLIAYCVSANGQIIKTRQTVLPVGISQLSNTIPGKFTLKQNYPNPFNPSTNLIFEIPNTEIVTLKIYNISGKEVETLINSELTPGIYTFEFNASDLPSGVYFYRLSVNGFTETKSMMLLK